MRSYLVSAALLIFSASLVSFAQSSSPKVESPTQTPVRSSRPKLRLQDGLRIAENYARDQNIDVSNYWLYEAKFILFGDKDPKQPAWFFWWVRDNHSLGDYVSIVVSMDGKAWRMPSM